MKYIFTYSTLLLTAASLTFCKPAAHSNNCSRYRNGTFKLQSRIDSMYWIIERKDSMQTETNGLTGSKLYEYVNWDDSCSYTIIRTGSLALGNDTAAFNNTKLPLHTTIVSTGENYYTFESHKDGIEMIYRDTMWVFEPNNKK